VRFAVAGYRYHSALKPAPGAAACCIRKERRRLPSKVTASPSFVEHSSAVVKVFVSDCICDLCFTGHQHASVCRETQKPLP